MSPGDCSLCQLKQIHYALFLLVGLPSILLHRTGDNYALVNITDANIETLLQDLTTYYSEILMGDIPPVSLCTV